MKSSWTKSIVLAAFVLTLGAGVMAGLLTAKLPHAAPTLPAVPAVMNSALADQLSLTPAQAARMKEIWESVRDLSDDSYQASRKIEEDSKQAVRALVPADKMDAYNAIMRKAQDDNASLIAKRQAAFDKAVKQTKEILSPPQQEKYDAILAKRLLGGESAQGRAPIGEATGPAVSRQPSS
jgi:Spy/CpxP family protein refolding chaperone